MDVTTSRRRARRYARFLAAHPELGTDPTVEQVLAAQQTPTRRRPWMDRLHRTRPDTTKDKDDE